MSRRMLVIAKAILPLCGCVSVPAFHLAHFGARATPVAPVAAAPTVCPAQHDRQ